MYQCSYGTACCVPVCAHAMHMGLRLSACVCLFAKPLRKQVMYVVAPLRMHVCVHACVCVGCPRTSMSLSCRRWPWMLELTGWRCHIISLWAVACFSGVNGWNPTVRTLIPATQTQCLFKLLLRRCVCVTCFSSPRICFASAHVCIPRVREGVGEGGRA